MPLPLAVTMGEPAGIGGEITLKAWLGRSDGLPAFLSDRRSRSPGFARSATSAGPSRYAPSTTQGKRRGGFRRGAAGRSRSGLRSGPGRRVRNRRDAPAILGAIETAVGDVRNGRAAALVTNPIHKDSLYRAGFPHPGHTEYLAELAGTGEAPIMMLACPVLRVVPVTIHLPLRRASKACPRRRSFMPAA